MTCDNFHEMMDLLANCPSLVRLSLIVTSIDLADGGKAIEMYKWHIKRFTNFFAHLVERLPKLIALLVVLPGSIQSHCIAATATLEKIYLPGRPCFCVQITDSLESNSPPNLPFGHYGILANDPPPLVGALPFHLLSQETRC